METHLVPFCSLLFFSAGFFAGISAQRPILDVTSVLQEPYLMQKYNDTGYEGYIKDMLDKLSEVVGFDYELNVVDQYGTLKSTGEWTGIVGDLVAGRADMAAAPLTVTSRRSMVVDFSVPFQSIGPVIVLRRPDHHRIPLAENLAKLLAPLEFSVWLMTVLAFLVTGTVLYIISHYNPYEWRRMHKDGEATHREAESFTCLNSFWFIISTLAWQGFVRTPRSMGGRILTTAWWFFCLIFLLTYTACLTNMLRVPKDQSEVAGYSAISSFEDLASKKDITIAILKGGSTQQYLRMSQRESHQAIFNQIMAHPDDSLINGSISNAIKELRQRKFLDFAVIMESAMARYFIHSRPCDLFMVSGAEVTKQYSLAFPIGSNFTKSVSTALLKIKENGFMHVLETKWFTPKCKAGEYRPKDKQRYETPTFHAMDLGTFSGALLILAAGLLFGGFITLVEYCIYKSAESHPDDDVALEENAGKQTPGTRDSLLRPSENSSPRKGGATPV